jgi:lysophospholipase L1-like esterase
MADPNPPSTARSTPAARRRRRIQRRILVGGSIGVLVVFLGLWFSDTIRIPTDGPRFAGGAELSSGDDGRPAAVAGADAPARRALNPLDPLRLWIGGDSLAGALGPALGQMTAQTGVVQPWYDSRVSTGLLADAGIDWPEHAREQLETTDPEVVVFVIGTNDAVIYDDSKAAPYALLTEEMMRVLVGDGREVYWVNIPVMADEDHEENVQKVNAIQEEVARTKFADHVTVIDAHTLFADETGEYVASLPDENGRRVSVRAGDGIHLSAAGGNRLALEIFDELNADWRILEQAVAGQAKRVIAARGSDVVPGGGSGGSGSGSSSGSSRWSGSSSGSGSGGGTTSTTAATVPATSPTSAPPATSPSTTPPSTPPSSAPSG